MWTAHECQVIISYYVSSCLQISLFLSPSSPLALFFVFVPGPFEGVFQNRHYWHWSPNQMQASLAKWNHEGQGGEREKGEWLGFSIKRRKTIFNTSWSSVFQICHCFKLKRRHICFLEWSCFLHHAEHLLGPTGRVSQWEMVMKDLRQYRLFCSFAGVSQKSYM